MKQVEEWQLLAEERLLIEVSVEATECDVCCHQSERRGYGLQVPDWGSKE
jgi:hypothetical protein